mgnify:CR=1 FL=1
MFTPTLLAASPSPALTAAVDTAHAYGPGPGGFGFLVFLIPLFWIAVFVLVVMLLTRRMRKLAWGDGSGRAPWAQGPRRAETTLAERFANGDIDETEYRNRLEVLRSTPLPERPKR